MSGGGIAPSGAGIVLTPAGGTGAAGATGSAGATGATGPTGATGGAGSFVTISKVVTSGSQATIHFASIPGSYTDLLLVIAGRDTDATSDGLSTRIKINSDATAGHYSDMQYMQSELNAATGGSVPASSAGFLACYTPGTLSNANAIGSAQITFPNYAGTAFFKTSQSNCYIYFSTFTTLLTLGTAWKSTAAITDLLLTAGGTGYVNGTTATLYGLG